MDKEISFGRFGLDLGRPELRCEGRPVRVHRHALDILCALAEAKGEIVSKDDLIARLWPGRIVEEGNLHVHVSELRRALDDQGEGHSHVVTVPGRGYRLAGLTGASPPGPAVSLSPQPLPLPDKPSIAVLPFTNLSGDPEQDYFADGMVEEIITALSRIRWLFVIARNSSFTYRGQAVDIKQVGRELGVRYVLEGSVRKVSGRVRIAAQLIDASNAAHLWADRFDGSLEDVFELQDRVAISVAGVIEPTLQSAEIRRSSERPINDLTAYDLYLRALPLLAHEEGETAFQLLNQALKRDPHCGPALSLASFYHYRSHLHHLTTDRQSARVQGLALARKALRHAPDDPEVLARTAFVLGYFGDDTDNVLALVDRSLELNPGYAMGWYWSAILRNWAGEPEDALVRFEKYLRLSPQQREPVSNGMGISLFLCRRFEEAAAKQRECLERRPTQTLASRFLAASYAHLGRLKEAREIGRRLGPALWDDGLRFRNLEQRELYLSGLRLASSQAGDSEAGESEAVSAAS
jgi:adenylate cyclase